MQWPCAILLYASFVALQYYLYYLINGTVLKRIVIEYKTCVLIFSTKFVRNISHSTKSWARYSHKYIDVHVKRILFLSDFNETWILLIDFRKNTSSGSRVIPCGRMYIWTDTTNVTVAFRNITKASEKQNKYIKKDNERMWDRKMLCIRH
jgi:hypothetical protein